MPVTSYIVCFPHMELLNIPQPTDASQGMRSCPAIF